jgi:hypothetical protein
MSAQTAEEFDCVMPQSRREGYTQWWKEPAREYATGAVGKDYLLLTPAQTGVYHRVLHQTWGPGTVPYDFEDIALRTHFPLSDVEAAIPILLKRGLLVLTPCGTRLYSPFLEGLMRANLDANERQAEFGRQGGLRRSENRRNAREEGPDSNPPM